MNNNLSKRPIQISGSYSNDIDKHIVEFSHSLIRLISKSFFLKDVAIVSLVGKEDCVFDWDILETAYEYAKYMKFSDKTKNIVIVISSDKNLKSHIPANRKDLWENLIGKGIVYLKHIGNINRGEFKRQKQEEFSSALLILGGGEGVESSADLHISHKKPVLAIDIPLGCSNRSTGSGGAPSIYKKSIEDPMKYLFRNDVTSKLVYLSYEQWKDKPVEDYAIVILDFLEMIMRPLTKSTDIPTKTNDENSVSQGNGGKNINIIGPKIGQFSINNQQGDNSPNTQFSINNQQGDNSPNTQGGGYSIADIATLAQFFGSIIGAGLIYFGYTTSNNIPLIIGIVIFISLIVIRLMKR